MEAVDIAVAVAVAVVGTMVGTMVGARVGVVATEEVAVEVVADGMAVVVAMVVAARIDAHATTGMADAIAHIERRLLQARKCVNKDQASHSNAHPLQTQTVAAFMRIMLVHVHVCIY